MVIVYEEISCFSHEGQTLAKKTKTNNNIFKYDYFDLFLYLILWFHVL